jgi:hypothetical protein
MTQSLCESLRQAREALELIARDEPTVEWSAPGGRVFTRYARTHELREIAQLALVELVKK